MYKLAVFCLLFCMLTACGDSSDSSENALEDSIGDNRGGMNGNNDDQNKDRSSGNNQSDNPLGDLMGALQNGNSVGEPVGFRDLREVLPSSIGGIQADDHEGETINSFGIRISNASAEYRGSDSRYKIEVTDIGSLSGLAAMGFAWANIEIDKESGSKVERTMEFNGNRAFLNYDRDRRNGDFSIIFVNRFVVKVTGYDVDIDDLQNVTSKVDFDRLGKWRDYGRE